MVHQDCVPFHVEDGSQLITNDGNQQVRRHGNHLIIIEIRAMAVIWVPDTTQKSIIACVENSPAMNAGLTCLAAEYKPMRNHGSEWACDL
jgi:hypothetical protein